MTGQFQYLYTQTSLGSLEIEDTGNVCIQTFNDDGLSWILVIKTYLGFTNIVEFGPYSVDGIEQHFVTSSFSKIEYSANRIDKIITAFLNNPKRLITQATIVDEDCVREQIVSMMELFDESCHQNTD